MLFSWEQTTTTRTREGVGRDGPPIGIGRGSEIRNAIIDKNARIGDNVVISPEGKDKEMDGEGFYIRDGIVVIPKGTVIASGTRI